MKPKALALGALLLAIPSVAAFSETFESCADQASPATCSSVAYTLSTAGGAVPSGCNTSGTTGDNVDGTQGWPGPDGKSFRMGSSLGTGSAQCLARWQSVQDWGGFQAGAVSCTGAAGEKHGENCGYAEKCGTNTAEFRFKIQTAANGGQVFVFGGLGGNLNPSSPTTPVLMAQLVGTSGGEILGAVTNQLGSGSSATPFTTHIFATPGVWYHGSVGPICNVSSPATCSDGGTGPSYSDRHWNTFAVTVPMTVTGGDLAVPQTKTFTNCLGAFSVNPTGYIDSFMVEGPNTSGTLSFRIDESGMSQVMTAATIPTVDAGNAIPAFGKDIGYASVVGQFLFGLVLVAIFFLITAGAWTALTQGAPGSTWIGSVAGVGTSLYNVLSGIWVTDIAVAILLLTAGIIAVLIRKLVWGRATGGGGDAE